MKNEKMLDASLSNNIEPTHQANAPVDNTEDERDNTIASLQEELKSRIVAHDSVLAAFIERAKNDQLIAEMVSGHTLEEVNASIEASKAAWLRLMATFRANVSNEMPHVSGETMPPDKKATPLATLPQVSAGGGGRMSAAEQMQSTLPKLSAMDKIRHGLKQ